MNHIYASLLFSENEGNNAIESCFNNIGLYIIQKIREEDFRKDKYTIDIEESAGNQRLNQEEVKAKIAIAEMIIKNKDILMGLEDFYEEECQLSLLNWACDIHKKLVKERYSKNNLNYNENINKNLFNKNSLDNNGEILLFYILNIFELFPIKPYDLKSLNFIDKLKEIKKDMKTQNLLIYKKIKNLIKFWKSIIKFFDNYESKKVSEKNIINMKKKRLREDDNTAKKDRYIKSNEIKEDIISNISIYETDSGEHNEIKKKSVSWKDDNILVDKIEYDPNNAPNDLLL